MTFTMPAGSGYVVTINEDGLSLITLDGAVIAEGPTMLFNGSWAYAPGLTRDLTLAEKSAESLPNGMVVRHRYTGAVTARVDYTYQVQGADVLVTARVTSEGAAIPVVGFKSPHVLVANWAMAQALGIGYGWDHTHTQDRGVSLAYPSSEVPMAAATIDTVTANGAPIRIAQWAMNDVNDPSMTLGFGIFQQPGVALAMIFPSEVPAGGARVFRWGYRLPACSGADLLGGYKAHLDATLQPRTTPIAKPFAQFAHLDPSHVRPDNPYGYQDAGDGWRRFDLSVTPYVEGLAPAMQEAGCAGLLMWQPQGVHPRGVMYRPDFHVWPAPVLANLPALVNGFAQRGLSVGLLARPSSTITSATWDTDWIARSGTSATALSEFIQRVRWAMDRGFQHWYLDSFIQGEDDHRILRAMRQAVGPDAQLFCEFSTVASLADAAGYEELRWESGAWRHSRFYQTLRTLVPASSWLIKFVGPLPPGGYADLFDYCLAERTCPLLDDWLIAGDVDRARTLMAARWGTA